MCHVRGGGTFPLILVEVYLQQHIWLILFQNYKAFWNIITLDANLQTKFNIQC